MTSALLSAQAVRIDEGGAPAVEQLTVETTGAAVAVVGAPRALFLAVSGQRDVSGGALSVAGLAPTEALRSGKLAAAPADAPLPSSWTALRLVTTSARLAGRGSRSALAAREALDAMQLGGYANVKLGAAAPVVRRAVTISAALATGAETLVVEDFSPGLPDEAARSLSRVFIAAARERRWLLFAGRLALSSPLGIQAEEALVFAGSRLLASGPPAEIAARERTFTLRVHVAPARSEGTVANESSRTPERSEGTVANESSRTPERSEGTVAKDKVEDFAERLRARGATVQPAGASLTVTMPEALTPRDLVLAAKDADLVVLELAPLAPALM